MYQKLANCFRNIEQCIYASVHYSTKGNADIETPSPRLSLENVKIAVYTCIVGHYDDLIEPFYVEPCVDYYVFTDMDCPKTSVWKKIDITQFEDYANLTPSQLNRKIKMMPFAYLPDYDYSIYIDGNVEIVSSVSPLIAEMGPHSFGVHYHRSRDCIYDEKERVLYLKKTDKEITKKQIKAYKKESFPHHYGLYENSILIRKHHDAETCHLMETWWKEYLKYPTRDQLSLPYVIWKTGYDRKSIHILGKNWFLNPRFNKTHSHDEQ